MCWMRSGSLCGRMVCWETVKQDASFTDVAGVAEVARMDREEEERDDRGGTEIWADGAPRGVLITGVQGCGKSLAAKAIAGRVGIRTGAAGCRGRCTTNL